MITRMLAITFFLSFYLNRLKMLSEAQNDTKSAHKRIGTIADKKILKNSIDFPKNVTSKFCIRQSNESNAVFPYTFLTGVNETVMIFGY